MRDCQKIDLNQFIDYYDSPSRGIYALYLKELNGLEFLGVQELDALIGIQDRIQWIHNKFKVGFLLYIGIAKKGGLKKRIAKHLLRTPRESTIRYSLAALAGYKAQKFSSKYTVNKTDNDLITNWLKKHTYFKIYECANDLVESLEDKYIEKYIPPLNISKNPQILSCVSSAREKFRASATVNL